MADIDYNPLDVVPYKRDELTALLDKGLPELQGELRAWFRRFSKFIHPDTLGGESEELQKRSEGWFKNYNEVYSAISGADEPTIRGWIETQHGNRASADEALLAGALGEIEDLEARLGNALTALNRGIPVSPAELLRIVDPTYAVRTAELERRATTAQGQVSEYQKQAVYARRQGIEYKRRAESAETSATDLKGRYEDANRTAAQRGERISQLERRLQEESDRAKLLESKLDTVYESARHRSSGAATPVSLDATTPTDTKMTFEERFGEIVKSNVEGSAALAFKDYDSAITYLERSLTLNPSQEEPKSLLFQAYTGKVGQLAEQLPSYKHPAAVIASTLLMSEYLEKMRKVV